MPLIPVRGKNGVVAYAVVDEQDFEWLNQYRWSLRSKRSVGKYGKQYVKRTESGTKRTILMHREILGLKTGDPRRGDHRDHDPLNNRRSNLRIATAAENGQNRRSWPNSTSKHRGVSFRSDTGKWAAIVKLNGKNNHLGQFDDEDAAAAAAAQFRREHMPYSIEE